MGEPGSRHALELFNLQGKVALVTGAARGLGQQMAYALAEAGADVAVCDLLTEPGEETAHRIEELGRRSWFGRVDVTRSSEIAPFLADVKTQLGEIDILVNNAGIGLRARVADSRPEDARRLMELNFFGALRCIQAVLPHMQRQAASPEGVRGQIVNIGSVLSAVAMPRNGIYSASKFALRALSDALRIELRGTGVDVILIMPGYIDTPFFENQIRYDGPVRVSPIKGEHPSKVAHAILRACVLRQREAVLTMPAKLGVWTKRFAPRLLDFFLARIH